MSPYIPVLLIVIAFLCGALAASELIFARPNERDRRRSVDDDASDLDQGSAS